jgi:hypothetical protein
MDLAEAYAAAWEEWVTSGDAELWNVTLADGLDDQPEEAVESPPG